MHNNPNPAVPDGMSAVSPHLICAGAAAAIAFYEAAFDAVEMIRLPGEDGKIMFAAVTINGSSILLADEDIDAGLLSPKALGGSPVHIHLIVPDADHFVAKAEAAGATVTAAVETMFWGDRFGTLQDPFGHTWAVATPQHQMSEDELKDAAANA